MASTHRALPVLLRICAVIDQLFIVEVGPFGRTSGNEIHQLDLATERLRASLMLAMQRLTKKQNPPTPPNPPV